MLWFSPDVHYRLMKQSVLLYRVHDYLSRRHLHSDMAWVLDRLAKGANPSDLVEGFRNMFPLSPVPLHKTLKFLVAENWLQDKEMVIRSNRQKFPSLATVNLRITNRCNYRCTHCFAESKKNVKGELSFHERMSLLREIFQYKPLHITITGGEPFLDPHVLEYADYANSNGAVVSFCTNASLIRDDDISRMSSMGLAAVKVSMDGIDEATHEFYRGRGTFKRVVSQVEKLVAAKIPVCINTVISKRNIHQVEQMVPFFSRLGVVEFAYDFIRYTGRAKTSWDQFALLPEEQKKCLKHFQSYYPTFEGMSMGGRVLPHIVADCLDEDSSEFACGTCLQNVMVLQDGTVTSCWRLLDRGEIAGSLREQQFSEIWSGSKLFHRIRSLKISDLEQCGHCSLNVFCDASCRGHAFAHHHDWYGPPDQARCEMTRNLAESTV